MTTPRKHRKPVVKGKQDPDRPQTPREEYRAALDELNRYSENNETAEAVDARDRFDKADRNRRRWWSFR
ncbi:hypothetical protein EV643_121155 [Kribbella sp. VKM Ac-2527]|uniref:Uncharacterized protein n=1 Tax=Kribbella caucasensis TaxID=2512215 RepID=A0A4R6JIB5_9ACTN|nr:hypothetical protein [Kribbella sp. VKM Ac-2527]TDO35880.1 hypothetical protein EV643_121155 [Kribbella sp. VKM Ac-2527]